jgi:hypothetical protein
VNDQVYLSLIIVLVILTIVLLITAVRFNNKATLKAVRARMISQEFCKLAGAAEPLLERAWLFYTYMPTAFQQFDSSILPIQHAALIKKVIDNPAREGARVKEWTEKNKKLTETYTDFIGQTPGRKE